MTTRLSRGVLVAVFVGSVLLPGVTSVAGPEGKLEKTKAELDRVRLEIHKDEDRESFLKRRVDALNTTITSLQIEINRLDAKISSVASKVRSQQAAIDRTQVKVDAIETEATAQAVALYKSSSAEAIDALLTATTLTELDQKVQMLGVAATRNTGTLIRYNRLQLGIEAKKRVLFAKKKELTAARTVQADLQGRMSKRRTQLAADLTELRVDLTALREREGDLEGDALRLTGDIQSAQARDAVAGLGESASGFIWPINGGITSYYGQRWGRMHTGIDIDGYTGQPIVASKQGTVILAKYYSGYGNAVVIDHGGGVSTLYAHMSSIDVSYGQYVEQGKIVGKVGCTGSCTGSHLHFEVRINGNPVDPLKYLP